MADTNTQPGITPPEDCVFTLLKDVTYASISEKESAVLDLKKRLFYTLNATGKRILESVDEGLSTREICCRISEEFEVEEDRCWADVGQFLNELRNACLIDC